jgi:radical SAM-linked protein
LIARLQFSKRGPIRFVSHRDVARIWERALRRSAFPVSFTEGFSPHPKVSFGLALPLGYESDCEYLDVTFDRPLKPALIRESLNRFLPSGIAVEAVVELTGSEASAASIVTFAEYLVAPRGVDEGPLPRLDMLEKALEVLESLPTWPVVPRRKPSPSRRASRAPKAHSSVEKRSEAERRSETEDLRPLVSRLQVMATPPAGFGPITLLMRLATKPRVVRPEEVCQLLTSRVPLASCEPSLVRRIAQLLHVDGGDPMRVPSTATRFPSTSRAEAPLCLPDERERSLPHATISTST